ncbi:MAG: signal peptide peptidase SppA [Candidatus Brocadiia bacterium]
MRRKSTRMITAFLVVVWTFFVGQPVRSGQQEVRIGPADDGALAPIRYAEIEIEGPILEAFPEVYLMEPNLPTIHNLVSRIKKAATDKSVDGLIIKVGPIDAGWGKVQELRDAIAKCQEAQKAVICFLQGGSNTEYYLASCADQVVMMPGGSLLLTGLRAEVMFVKGLLEKIGVKGQIVQVGEFKGAAETFSRMSASQSFRESMNALLDSYYRQFIGGMAKGRNMKEAEMRNVVNKGPYTAPRAEASGLVDGLMFYDELLEKIKKKEKVPLLLTKDYGQKKQKLPLGSTPQKIMKTILGMGGGGLPQKGFPGGTSIAVVHAVGPIVQQSPKQVSVGESVINAARMVKLLRRLRKRDNVKAVVLRVDSPGGSAVASDMIWHELRAADKTKPVVASMSDVAGSGGYYIASGARHIFAHEGTITGSIGVVGGKFVMKGLFDKIGVNVDVFERGDNAGLLSSIEEFSDSEEKRFRQLLEQTYDLFVQRVAKSRGASQEEIEKWAAGRAMTGAQAKKGNLIDEIGGLAKALEKARELAGIDVETDVEIVHLPKSQSILEVMMVGRDPGVITPQLKMSELGPRQLRAALSYLRGMSCLDSNQPAALMPGWITIR